jgi:glutathione S-transferase
MTITLYDLCGADRHLRFSPYCWRTKLALAHKSLDFETVPVRFSERDCLAFADWDKLPVLVDGETTVPDSPRIAAYLETAYPERPSLFGGAAGEAVTRFVESWSVLLQSAMVPILVADIFERLAEEDRAYFRETREARLGMTMEEAKAAAPQKLAQFHPQLKPLDLTLKRQDFLGGATPLYADYIVGGAFQWAAKVSDHDLIGPNEGVAAWFERLRDRFGGSLGF